jgi:cobaltochelatase CobN
MHLLLAQKGTIQEGNEAIDLGQSPGDIIFLSAADTELASLAGAQQTMEEGGLSLRLVNLMQLSHPMSIDLYAEKTLAGARLVVLRILGGKSYWAYGLETFAAKAASKGIKLAVLSGDDKPDSELAAFSTVTWENTASLHAYLVEGGPHNMRNFLRYCHFLLDGGEVPEPPVPLLKAGLWYPGKSICAIEDLKNVWRKDAPVAAICFYRALVQSGGLKPISALIKALQERDINAMPIFVSSLKDPVSVETVRSLFAKCQPDIVLNATGFAVSKVSQTFDGAILEECGTPVLQFVLAGGTFEAWENSAQGLSARDLAMNVALPEIDGRVLSRAIAFKHAGDYDAVVETNIVTHSPVQGRVAFVVDLAAAWVKLRQTPARSRKIALILANYPNRDGRIGNGVGLDTPAGTANVLKALRSAGYTIGDLPEDGDGLIRFLTAGPTNAARDGRAIRETLSLADYQHFFSRLSDKVRSQIIERWGEPEKDPFFDRKLGAFALPLALSGNIALGIQPARGYNIDPKESYHSPDLVPPHGYFAFYAWLREKSGVHAIVHMGKHGNLEWLPGKALALGENCFPEAALGPVPHLYPFIVNDPGEGSQAKRRSSAVIVDHLTPPLTRAESYGPLRDLESLVDEYYEASGNDPRRLKLLGKQIFDLVANIGLNEDAGIIAQDDETQKLTKLDAWLCELKELQIRDGLHIFGAAPQGRLAFELAVALVRVPRGAGEGRDQSLQRAIANDLALGLDPLDCDMAEPWTGLKPPILAEIDDSPWRITGDTVERIELMALKLVSGEIECQSQWPQTKLVIDHVHKDVLSRIAACGDAEIKALLGGLDGKFVEPGPSGAPSRGRMDVLPTGRNFYSVDSRSVPTNTAWVLGQKSAELLVTRFRQDHGEWPRAFGLSAWGTSNMRTGGDDIAQAMALIGAKPIWDHGSNRVTGYEIITLAGLGRPRVDVILRISGFFRDAFPAQIELFDKAVRAIGALDEAEHDNPIAARINSETRHLIAEGMDEKTAQRRAGYRIFGSKPGAYGAGLQALIDEKGWERRSDLADAYIAWGSYAYGAEEEGIADTGRFAERLSKVQAVVHNQDNREHDLLDSDDYYQFEGGMSAAVEQMSGNRPKIYHNDHSRPERPVVNALEEEVARIIRGRAANPKWISGVMRHGYKGAFEMAATLDYMFAFAATTGAVRSHHFTLVYDAWIANDQVREFIAEHNPAVLREMAERFLEAQQRGMWTARSNSAKFELEKLTAT